DQFRVVVGDLEARKHGPGSVEEELRGLRARQQRFGSQHCRGTRPAGRCGGGGGGRGGPGGPPPRPPPRRPPPHPPPAARPPPPSGSRLVARMCSRGQLVSRRSATSRQPVARCSQLSRTISAG